MGVDDAKRALRRVSQVRRREAAAEEEDAAMRAAEWFSSRVPLASGAAVSGYWPVRDEFDPRPLMERLHGAGHPCSLPVVVGPRRPLVFRAWTPGAPLEPVSFGLSVPPASAAMVVPEVLLVPLLAFDGQGYRLGYGGGFYDRTLAALRAGARPVLGVGIGYGAQEVDEVPHGPADERLDWVVTEREARRIG